MDRRAVPPEEVLAEAEVLPRAGARQTPADAVGEGLETANLFAIAEQLAARAATPSTRRQYATIYRSFADRLLEQLGRPPTVADVHADAIAAYARFLGRPVGAVAGPRRWPRDGSILDDPRWPAGSAVTTSPLA